MGQTGRWRWRIGGALVLLTAACPPVPDPGADAALHADGDRPDATPLADAAMQTDAARQTDAAVGPDGGLGTYLGDMWNTYYYLALEADYSGAADTVLYDAACSPIATVPAAYSDDVCIEGSGQLADGRVINYATSCTCGRSCPTGGIVCYAVLDPQQFPWGMGSTANPLEPLRSWAVDSSLVSAGTILYAVAWDGVAIPALGGLGGFVHDGCFRADDVGGWITGLHYDFFAGTADLWMALEAIVPTNSTAAVYVDPPRCAHLAP